MDFVTILIVYFSGVFVSFLYFTPSGDEFGGADVEPMIDVGGWRNVILCMLFWPVFLLGLLLYGVYRFVKLLIDNPPVK